MNDQLDAEAAELLQETSLPTPGAGIIQQIEESGTAEYNPMTLEGVVDVIEEFTQAEDQEVDEQESELANRDLEEELRSDEQSNLFPDTVNIDTLEEVKTSLQAIYPDRWELTYNHVLDYINIVIYWPEVEVTNSKSMRHTIKDLYFRVRYHPDWTMAGRMEGRRATVTWPEYNSRHRFSHIPGNSTLSREKWAGCCLGASELSAMETEAQMGPFDIIQFELWMYQLDAYVRWESIGGGPYNRLSNITAGSLTTTLGISTLKIAAHIFGRTFTKFPLTFDKGENKFKIPYKKVEQMLNSKKLLEYNSAVVGNVYSLAQSWCKTNGTDYVFEVLDYPMIHDSIQAGNDITDNYFYFKGEKVEFKILPFDQPEDLDNLQRVIHPQITEYIKNKLETVTNRYFIKKYGK